MLISIGLQNKIIQAMAMKIPCIVSKTSNNAIKAPNNIAIIEAEGPEEFAKAMIVLLNDEARAKEIGTEGYNFVKENFCWRKQNTLLSELIQLKN